MAVPELSVTLHLYEVADAINLQTSILAWQRPLSIGLKPSGCLGNAPTMTTTQSTVTIDVAINAVGKRRTSDTREGSDNRDSQPDDLVPKRLEALPTSNDTVLVRTVNRQAALRPDGRTQISAPAEDRKEQQDRKEQVTLEKEAESKAGEVNQTGVKG